VAERPAQGRSRQVRCEDAGEQEAVVDAMFACSSDETFSKIMDDTKTE
jgi:hypothetical protein